MEKITIGFKPLCVYLGSFGVEDHIVPGSDIIKIGHSWNRLDLKSGPSQLLTDSLKMTLSYI
jgi:hypothetical protein